MSTPCKCRFDAAGKRILPHAAMLLYFKDDPKSTDLLKRNMPYRLVCVPAIEIHIPLGEVTSVTVYKIYPGETENEIREVSVRAVEGLRRTYRRGKGWRATRTSTCACVLRREGRVILDPKKRYGIWH